MQYSFSEVDVCICRRYFNTQISKEKKITREGLEDGRNTRTSSVHLV